ncbi:MAG: hypothetical protein R3F48_08500 [Candidatus Zixiibacteriota bacterium]
MKPEFIYPLFEKGKLELRFENDIVCIYGTKEGLLKLIEVIQTLIDNPDLGHIHLEDSQQLLTIRSRKGAVAIFD